MDEILIEEKRYVSSKRAAKMTGYAKDYVGQLCREGRVPARLVGRSWYVLESAIQDHRFGAQDTDGEKKEVEESVSQTPNDTWESPRYESFDVDVEILPSLDRTESRENGQEPVERHQDIHDSWREWFDRVADTPVVESVDSQEEEIEVSKAHEEEKTESDVVEDAVVDVPLRIMSHPVPRELLPRSIPQAAIRPLQEERHVRPTRGGMAFTRSIQVAAVLVALVSLTLATIGSGYFDEYVVAHTEASALTGAVMYSR